MIRKEYSNIREVLEDSINEFPDNNAFIIKNTDKKTYTNISFKKFGEDINCLGEAFLKLGLKDKKVAIISKNRYEWALGYYAVVNGLGLAVPLDKGLPADEIENSLVISGAEAIIFEEKYYETIKNIIDKKTTKLSMLICMDKINDDVKNIHDLIELGKDIINKGSNEFSSLPIDNDKTSIILFTSGTTSIAKAVELSHRNIASNINGLNVHEELYPTDVNMAFLPFHHTFGSSGLLWILSNGVTTTFCDGIRYIQKNLIEYKVSVFFCVPAIIEGMHKKIMHEIEKQGKMSKVKFAKKISRFLLKFKIDIRRKLFKDIINSLGGGIRFVINGAAALDKQVEIDFNDFGILAVQGYGLTESSPVLTGENEFLLRPGSIGKPLYNVELKIDNPDEFGVGEIIAKGPNIMKGYYKNEEATNEILKNGWLHTGDLGYMDKDGFFYISGRKKNVVVLKNGKNVYPEELEILVDSLPYVKENMVFGTPKDDDLLLTAKIVYDKDYMKNKLNINDEKEIKGKIWTDIKEINKDLSIYKHIKKIIITEEEMIKTTTGKVKRAEEIKKCLK